MPPKGYQVRYLCNETAVYSCSLDQYVLVLVFGDTPLGLGTTSNFKEKATVTASPTHNRYSYQVYYKVQYRYILVAYTGMEQPGLW